MSAEEVLAQQGVFKGADGLRALAESEYFWDEQPYSTRLYFGPGAADYLHRDVLRAAVAALSNPLQVRVDGMSDGGFRHPLKVEGTTQLRDGVLGVVVQLPKQIGEMKCWLNDCKTVEQCAESGCALRLATQPQAPQGGGTKSERFQRALNAFGFDGALEQTLKERDHYHEVADDLAYRIEALTQTDIGEHSSSNNPWQNAKDAADEMLATPAPQVGEGVAPEVAILKEQLNACTATLQGYYLSDDVAVQGIARHRLAALLDIWDDGKKPHEYRAYVDGAFESELEDARKYLAAPTETPEAGK
jgi:hypothetical protein